MRTWLSVRRGVVEVIRLLREKARLAAAAPPIVLA
jgi:hypothetical protein